MRFLSRKFSYTLCHNETTHAKLWRIEAFIPTGILLQHCANSSALLCKNNNVAWVAKFLTEGCKISCKSPQWISVLWFVFRQTKESIERSHRQKDSLVVVVVYKPNLGCFATALSAVVDLVWYSSLHPSFDQPTNQKNLCRKFNTDWLCEKIANKMQRGSWECLYVSLKVLFD